MGLISKGLAYLTSSEDKEEGSEQQQQGPEDLTEGRGNEAAAADVAVAPQEEEAGFLDAAAEESGPAVAGGQGGGGQAQAEPPDDPTGHFAVLRVWLSTPELAGMHLEPASELLKQLSAEQRREFLELEDGELYANLEAAYAAKDQLLPEEIKDDSTEAVTDDRSWGEWAWDQTAALGTGLGEIVADKWNGEEAGIDLNSVQRSMGGSILGMKLDDSTGTGLEGEEGKGDNDLQITGSLVDGRVDARIPRLDIAEIDTNLYGTNMRTGSGTLREIHATLDGKTSGESNSEITMSMGALDVDDISLWGGGLGTTFVSIGNLMLVGVNAVITKRELAPEMGPEALAMEVKDDLVEWAYDLLQQIPMVGAKIGADGGDGRSALDSVIANFTGQSNFQFSVASTSIDVLKQGTATEGGELDQSKGVTTVGSIDLGPLSVALETRDTLEALREEQKRLSESAVPLSATQAERLEWMEGEIERLVALRPRYEELAQRIADPTPLSPEEQDEWVVLEREFATGVASIHMAHGQVRGVTSTGVDEDGNRSASEVKSTDILGVEATVTASKLGALGKGGVHNAGPTRAENLDARLGIAPEAEEGANPIDGMYIDATVQHVSADGAASETKNAAGEVTSSSGAESVVLQALDLEAGGDAADLELDHGAVAGAHFDGNSIDTASVSGVDISARGDDVGGYVGAADVTGVDYADDSQAVKLDEGAVQGVRFDADVSVDDEMEVQDALLRSGSAEGGQVAGLDYESDGMKVTAGEASIEDMSATQVGMDGSGETFDLARASGEDLHYSSVDSETGDRMVVNAGSAEATDIYGRDFSTREVMVENEDGEMEKSTDVSGRFGLGGANGQDIQYSSQSVDEEGKVSQQAAMIDSAGVGAVDVHRDESGTVARAQDIHAEGITAKDVGEGQGVTLDSMQIDEVAAALDGEDELAALSVSGFTGEDLKVELSRMPLTDAPTAEDIAAAKAAAEKDEAFAASAFSTASGTMTVDIPVDYSNLLGSVVHVRMVVPVTDGVVNLADVVVQRDGTGVLGKFLKDNTDSFVRIDEGRGLVAKMGPLSVMTLMDTNDWSGLQSAKAGGGKKGAIHIKPMIEGFMNGTSQAQLDEGAVEEMMLYADESGSRKERRRRRKEDKRARKAAEAAAQAEEDAWEAREDLLARADSGDEEARAQLDYEEGLDETQARSDRGELSTQDTIDHVIESNEYAYRDKGLDIKGISVNVSGLSIGAGTIGTESGMATFDERGVEDFNMEFDLDQSMRAGASHIGLESIHLAGDSETGSLETDVQGMGLDGLDVEIARPLDRDRHIKVGVEDMAIQSVEMGEQELIDTEKLGRDQS